MVFHTSRIVVLLMDLRKRCAESSTEEHSPKTKGAIARAFVKRAT
jgi:hypothetical protein